VKIPIYVKPGSSATEVGGSHGGALVVRVTAKPVGGKANEAVEQALAKAFGLSRAKVRLVAGGSGRSKLVELDDEEGRLAVILGDLLSTTGDKRPRA
jgi:uncharacterized protein YggU (UPF0235/DUF167 family)